jgi:hypothetical protein
LDRKKMCVYAEQHPERKQAEIGGESTYRYCAPCNETNL